MNTRAYNPYEDPALHATQTHRSRGWGAEERVPFNDAISHFDTVNGFRMPKRIEELPSSIRTAFRIYALVSAVSLAAVLADSLISSVGARLP
ncbi:hypothetical protein ACP26L_02010 [Paenibacillus sp. S-38]|uniref:hypothetical protein n=1 Tax=Paenibacillus sp. S-38 TaxID=3416710 RepID=UPI003CF4613D